jgi:glycerophosphoryl diester phosphodiesterase
VHATADGVVVVHHDPVTYDGLEIAQTSWSVLQHAPAGPMGSPAIPSLASVCDLAGGRAELFVEIKGAGIEVAVVAALEGRTGSFALHSFDHAMIGRLARRRVPYRLGLLFEEAVTDPAALLISHGARDAWPHHTLVNASLLERVHGAGGRVITWTVNSQRDAQRLSRAGVDGICTDDVTLLDVLEG